MAVFVFFYKAPSSKIYTPEPSAHVVRFIKADQAAALLPAAHHDHTHAAKGPRKPAEVRLVGTGPDYCDLELICGCGEVTRFRAWNSPGESAKAA